MFEKKLPFGEWLFDYLYEQGIHHAFGLPGDFVLPTIRKLEASKIELYTLTHEPSVGFAADAYARINGLGLACITYCVGGLNMVNAIACAYAEKSPVIVISGGPSLKDREHDPLLHHKVKTFETQRRVYEEVTCATTILLEMDQAVAEVIRVVETVKTQCRPGYIEIPYDVLDVPIIVPSLSKKKIAVTPVSDAEALAAFISETTEAINRAKQPVMILDVELHRHRLTDLAMEIATKFSIPMSATLLSKSIIPERHPLYLGVYSGGLSEPACQEYIEHSDCVIMLGTFITDVFLGQYTAHLERKNTIMLTTEQASIGVHNFHEVQFDEALRALVNAKIHPRSSFHNPNPPALPSLPCAPETQVTVSQFFSCLGRYMTPTSTIICDTGDALLGAIGLRTESYKHFFSDAYYLSMGFAVPAAIGAMVADPSQKVIAIVGDGAFQMTGTEISTALKYQMAPIVCILNNDGYGTQRHIIDGPFNQIQPWNYTAITQLIGGGVAKKVKTMGELEKALSEAMKGNELTLIEVVVPKEDCSISLRKMGEQLGKLRNKSNTPSK